MKQRHNIKLNNSSFILYAYKHNLLKYFNYRLSFIIDELKIYYIPEMKKTIYIKNNNSLFITNGIDEEIQRLVCFFKKYNIFEKFTIIKDIFRDIIISHVYRTDTIEQKIKFLYNMKIVYNYTSRYGNDKRILKFIKRKGMKSINICDYNSNNELVELYNMPDYERDRLVEKYKIKDFSVPDDFEYPELSKEDKERIIFENM